jgi:hypothetical protein
MTGNGWAGSEPHRDPLRALSVIVAWTPATVVSRSSVMSLIITLMFEPGETADELGQRERSQEPAPLAGRDDRRGGHAATCSVSASAVEIARAAPLCTKSHRPWRNGWQFVCWTGVPVVARMWARKSGDSMWLARSRRFASLHAGVTLR